MYGKVAHCFLFPWAECMECLWETWQSSKGRMVAWISLDLFGGWRVCKQKGASPALSLPYLKPSLHFPAWHTKACSVWRLPSLWPRLSLLHANNQPLSVPTDLYMSLFLLMPISPSEMLSDGICCPLFPPCALCTRVVTAFEKLDSPVFLPLCFRTSFLMTGPVSASSLVPLFLACCRCFTEHLLVGESGGSLHQIVPCTHVLINCRRLQGLVWAKS